MKRPRLIVGILAVTHLLLAVMVFLLFNRFPNPVAFWERDAALLMFLPCQGNLVGVWTALSGKGIPLRVMLIAVAFVVGTHYQINRFSLDLGIAFALFLVQMVNVTAVLLIFRLTGLELTLPPVEAWEPRPFQFTIGQMMGWTATVAVIFSACHSLPNEFVASSPYSDLPSYAIHGSCTAAALASLWLVLGKGWLPVRMLVVVGAVGGGAVLLNKTIDILSYAEFSLLLALQAAWTILSLLVIRWAGYRMTWHWQLRRFKELAQ